MEARRLRLKDSDAQSAGGLGRVEGGEEGHPTPVEQGSSFAVNDARPGGGVGFVVVFAWLRHLGGEGMRGEG